jgi:hypothetical protein
MSNNFVETNKNELSILYNNYMQIINKNLFLHRILYVVFYQIPIVFLLYILFFYPISIFFHVGCFIISYFQEQILFILTHLSFHLSFNYVKPTINDMGLFYLGIGYLHHYYNPFIFSQMNFYSYCIQYIENNTDKTSLINQYNSYTKNVLCFLFFFVFFIPNNLILLYLYIITAQRNPNISRHFIYA